VALVGCSESQPFNEPQTLGGVEVSAETLNRGRTAYRYRCASCHGVNGDGRGPTAGSQHVAPRDFRTAAFKFAGSYTLPADEDLLRIVRGGLGGTRMVAPHLPDTMLQDILHYIKTFSPPGVGYRHPKHQLGEPMQVSSDPWTNIEAAVSRGREVFHSAAGCHSCHKSDEGDAAAVAAAANAPDLRTADLRVAHLDGGVYRVIAYGIPTTDMPSSIGSLPERDIWAMTHYVLAESGAGSVSE
jgi:cytochrome c oxidase cbb3-type subunit 2